MARVACSPLIWENVLFEAVLDDAANVGYHGVEALEPAVAEFARQPGRLRGALEERALRLAGAPFAAWYFERAERRDEVERLRRLAGFLGEAGPEGIVLFRTVPHPARRDMVAGEPPLLPLTRDRLAYLSDALNQYCDLCRDFGLRGAFQNRVGSFVETPDEFAQVVERTEPGVVWLAPDLGHWAYAGGDPTSVIRDYLSRIACPRLKDFDPKVFEHVRGERLGFAAFVSAGGFKELGEGALDLAAALAPLEDARYTGWVTVDLERTEKPPVESARISREYLRDRLRW